MTEQIVFTVTKPMEGKEVETEKYTIGGKTEQEWKDLAKEYLDRFNEGLETEASNNFRSQMAWSMMQDKFNNLAQVAHDKGITQTVLFDLEGNYIPGKWVNTQYGSAWLTTEGKWLNPSQARNEKTAIKNNAKKGFYEGRALFLAHFNHNERKAYAVTTSHTQLIKAIDNGQ